MFTSWNTGRATRWMTSCAIRSPRWNLTASAASVLSSVTLISPRYPASTVPGAFTSVTPCFAARPERGCTNAAYPSGSAMASPVRTSARSPGASSTSSAAVRSAPASPGWAYDGSGTPGSSRLISTSGSERGNEDSSGKVLAPARRVRIARHLDAEASLWVLRSEILGFAAAQFGQRTGDHGHDGHGHHGPGDAGQDTAGRERQDNRQRVQPDHLPDHLRLEQMGFQLVLDDQDPEQDDSVEPALGGQGDHDGQHPRAQKPPRRD